MAADNEQLRHFSSALEDHGAEGIEILYSEPSKIMRATILLIVAFVLAALIWSFFGRADVIVSAPGVLSPDEEVRRVFSPIGGELVEIFVAEGVPVSKGDVLARLNARDAIQVATKALEAELALAEVEQEYKQFPARRELMERHAEALKQQIETAQRLQDKRITEGLDKLAQSQRANLEEARGNLKKAGIARDSTHREWEKFKRLFARPGGGGVSKNQVEEKRDQYLATESDYSLAEARLGELEFQLSEEYAQSKAELEGSNQRLAELRIEYGKTLNEIERETHRTELKYRSAQLAAEMAGRIRFDNIDEENFLRILAPVSGVVTHISFKQPGDNIPANTPMISIAPRDSRTVLKVDINERDRGFLREGLPVKMKFSAFPYQRYGFITGTLDYISPSTQGSTGADAMVYKGNVSLDRDYYSVGDIKYPLRFGMTATAEIVVQKRRLIDFALDPLREI
ncbi:MAG: HlyD family efflux transporter periplasmic adaptor subunit [Gammaproteobacteria bacterium]|nr:MAG: HlyD family efflux transporter periplasmic adaptor subunit [Gammaproteobacteria bacterium]